MNVLISAFECNPYKGSDSYVGWSYVFNASKYNKVFVITRAENRGDIETYSNKEKLENITFFYVEQSKFWTRIVYKFSKKIGFLGSYLMWQNGAYCFAKRINREYNIDVIHHVSIADYRVIGKLWRINKPFVFGPVGGAQETPECLKKYVKGHNKSELARTFINISLTNSINYRRGLKKASIVFASNEETKEAMQKKLSKCSADKIIKKTELCIDENYIRNKADICNSDIKDKECVHIIVTGRLIYRKGIELLIDAISRIDTKKKYVVDIYGNGAELERLENKVKEMNIADRVLFHGNIPFVELQKKYETSDIYVLPSLRETTGTAVFEAMANKLPVVSLKQNGVKDIVGEDSGILVPLTEIDEILDGLAAALTKLIENPELRIQLGQNGFDKLKENYTWQIRAKEMNELYFRLMN